MTDAAVRDCVVATFEEMAFLDVQPGHSSSSSEVPPGPLLYQEYHRPRGGALSLKMPKEVKFEIAESIYGVDTESLPAGTLDDSLLEFMNVLVGRLLTDHFADAPYAMGLPTVLYDEPEVRGWESQDFVFHADEHCLILTWYKDRS